MKKSRLKRQQLGSKAVGTLPPSPQDLAEMIENRLIQSPSKVLPMFFQSSSKVLSKFSQSSPKVLPKSSQGPPKVNPKSSQNPPKVLPKSSQSRPKVLPKSSQSHSLVRTCPPPPDFLTFLRPWAELIAEEPLAEKRSLVLIKIKKVFSHQPRRQVKEHWAVMYDALYGNVVKIVHCFIWDGSICDKYSHAGTFYFAHDCIFVFYQKARSTRILTFCKYFNQSELWLFFHCVLVLYTQ